MKHLSKFLGLGFSSVFLVLGLLGFLLVIPQLSSLPEMTPTMGLIEDYEVTDDQNQCSEGVVTFTYVINNENATYNCSIVTEIRNCSLSLVNRTEFIEQQLSRHFPIGNLTMIY